MRLGSPRGIVLFAVLIVWAALPVRAADTSIVVLAPTATDDRLDPSRQAVAFWNDRLAELGVDDELIEPLVVVESPVVRALENYARQVATRAVGLPGGAYEPAPPAALTRRPGKQHPPGTPRTACRALARLRQTKSSAGKCS